MCDIHKDLNESSSHEVVGFLIGQYNKQRYRQHLGYNRSTKVILKEYDHKASHSESHDSCGSDKLDCQLAKLGGNHFL